LTPALLSEVLSKAPAAGVFRDLIVGNESRDDAAVYRLNDAQALASAERRPVDTSAMYLEQMKLTQETLTSFGYATGAIDGIMRFETASALRAFQREQGLKVTGQANPETLAALGIEDRLYRRPR